MTGAAFGIGRIHWNWFAALAVLLAALPLVSETNTPTLLPFGPCSRCHSL